MAASMPNPEMIKKNKEDIAALNANFTNGHVYYNANTNRAVESNRINTLNYLLSNVFNKTGANVALARYDGGYYMAYFYLGYVSSNSTHFVLEICHGITEKLVMWQKNSNGWEKNTTI